MLQSSELWLSILQEPLSKRRLYGEYLADVSVHCVHVLLCIITLTCLPCNSRLITYYFSVTVCLEFSQEINLVTQFSQMILENLLLILILILLKL